MESIFLDIAPIGPNTVWHLNILLQFLFGYFLQSSRAPS